VGALDAAQEQGPDDPLRDLPTPNRDGIRLSRWQRLGYHDARLQREKSVGMKPIRVLVSDADVLARHKIISVLEAAGDMVCEAVSPEGVDLLANIAEDPPDVLLLDMEETSKNDPHLLSRIHELRPGLPVVALVSRSKGGAELTIDLLLEGLSEFVTKPENGSNVLFADGHLQKRLPPILRMAAGHHHVRSHPARGRDGLHADTSQRSDAATAIAIGGCSGAVPILNDLLAGLAPSPACVLVAQHMPRFFTTALARRLSLVSARPVVEASNNDLLDSDTIWLAPGGHHMGIRVAGYHHLLHVHRGRRESGCRPSIDALFRSVAETFQEGAVGIILSGCAMDGLRGCRAIRDHGGRVLVQDPDTAQVPDLPNAVITGGLATHVLPPDELTALMNREASRAPLPAFPLT